METKKEIRAKILKQRSLLPEPEIEKSSRKICETVIAHPWFIMADTVLLYMDYNHEVLTRQMIERAWEMGKCVGVPKVRQRTMEYCRIEAYSDLEAGTFGIREPKEGCMHLEISSAGGAAEKVLAIMPGVAFDRKLNRIGYGGGYYDRYFEDRTKIKKIAVAFEAQMVPHIEAETFDLRPDCIVTERQLYRPD